MKVLFTVKPKDRNDLSGTIEFERRVFDIKRMMMSALGGEGYALETGFNQASVLYPKRFMFDYDSGNKALHDPKRVIDAFFDAIERTGICISKYDVHVTITWP